MSFLPFMKLTLLTELLVFLILSTTATAWDDTAEKFQLPRVQVQFICSHDVRPDFNESSVFEEFYRQYLPDLNDTRFRSSKKISGMVDIPPTKWYYSSCNISSPQVLATLEIDGWVQFLPTANQTSEDDYQMNPEEKADLVMDLTPDTIEDYFRLNVCNDEIEFFHAVVEDWRSADSLEVDQRLMDHSLFLLCGGDDVIYYDEGAPDSGVVLFGFIVGAIMVGMIFSELQKFEIRPHPRSSRQRRDYLPTYTQELEMV